MRALLDVLAWDSRHPDEDAGERLAWGENRYGLNINLALRNLRLIAGEPVRTL